MVKKAEELAKKNGWFLARQFENPANPEYHRNTTGPEILRDFAGKRLDYWVTGYGTGGTLTGAGEMLKKARPDTKIVVTEPEGAALLSGQEWKPHKIQGWTPNFIPAVLDRKVVDEIVTVAGHRGARRGARPRDARRASSAASPPAARSPPRRRSPRRRRRAPSSWRCCPTRASATSRRSSSRGSTREPTRCAGVLMSSPSSRRLTSAA